jgi:hypothetical protein
MFYKAYGLIINSEIPLPELKISSKRKVDISIICRKTKPPIKFDECDFGDFKVRKTIKGLYILLNDICICKISFGKKITINPHNGLEKSFLRVIILGPALSFLLNQRGYLILHASAININGGAVAFLGTNGVGKSTTIMALQKFGYPLITDDILPVSFNEKGNPLIISSYSRLKLWPDILSHLIENVDECPPTYKNSKKYSYFADNFSETALPLKKIYFLEKDKEFRLINLDKTESVMKLIESSYCYGIFNSEEIIENISKCSKVVENVPTKVLKVHHSIEKIRSLVKIIENDNL